MRVAEAMLLLVLAKFLIDHLRFGRWRHMLGKMEKTAASLPLDPKAIRPIIVAIYRATARLRGEYVCLPRAMAVQWMLRRRGIVSTLVFGIARDLKMGSLHDLHAWVEVGGTIVIGDMPEKDFTRWLELEQP